MKKQIINFLSKISFVNTYFSGIATIFMLHRVYPFEPNKLFPNENMKVSPEFLEEFIIELKKRGYSFISLDELYEILKNRKKVRKCVLFTLDDGYKDNFEIAYPMFKYYNVPFAIYVTTSFPNKNAILWWYALEDLIINNDELKIGSKVFKCKTYEEKNSAFLKIREIILDLNQRNLLNELNNLFADYKIDWFKYNNNLCMSWEDIITVSKERLCTIGGHTKNHYVFSKLNKEEILEEIAEANKEIEKRVGIKVEHFAYPFGSEKEVGKREMEIVKEIGFKTVTTTRRGNIYLKHRDFVNCCLPRIMLTENFNIKNIGRIRKKRIVTI